MSKDSQSPLFAVLVRCLEHWFIPHHPDSDKQCVFTTRPLAEKAAHNLHLARPKAYREIRVVEMAG